MIFFFFFLFCHGGHGVMNDLESKGIHIYVWSFLLFMHSCFYIADISGIGVGLGSLKYSKPLYFFQIIYFQTFVHKDENSDRKKKSIITTTLVYIHRTSYAGIIAHNLPQSSPSTSLSNFPLWTSNLLRSRLASPGITSLSMHPLLVSLFSNFHPVGTFSPLSTIFRPHSPLSHIWHMLCAVLCILS